MARQDDGHRQARLDVRTGPTWGPMNIRRYQTSLLEEVHYEIITGGYMRRGNTQSETKKTKTKTEGI
jgi:hypothetical protein